jgi:DNA-binding HxlR family transcriptional regulator
MQTGEHLMTTSGLDAALERVGDRWTLQIVDALLERPQRFGELATAVPGIAPNVLTVRLRRLEQAGLVVSRAYQRRPVRLEYALTETGRALADTLAVLGTWGATLEGSGEATTPAHDACGTPLELAWWCPTCERSVQRDEADELHHL